jgi:PAS domain S-box-containing protein
MLTQNPWRRPAPRRRTIPLLVLITATIASVAFVWLFHRGGLERDEARFRNAVQSTTDRISGRLEAYTAVLLAARGMFVANDVEVDLIEFQRFVAELELQSRYPGIQGVGFTRRFTRVEIPEIERHMQRQGMTEFVVWPKNERDEVHSILYLEPLDRRNLAAIGYDMYTEEERREAMRLARDTARPAATGPVTLVQEIDSHKQTGFLIYMPLYAGGRTPDTVEERRANLVGYVYAPFRVDDLLAGIFGSEEQHRVTFAIRDAGSENGAAYLHRSADKPDAAEFATTAQLAVAGRIWVLEFASLPVFEAHSATWLLPYAMTAALVVIGLLFLLSLTQARAHDQFRVHKQILDSMTEGVSVADERGVILYTNPAEDRMFGYDRGELIGKPVTVLNTYPPEENSRIVAGVIEQLRRQGEWTGEFANVKNDGTKFTTAARISALELAGKSYWVCVHEDITERKHAEHERAELLEREQALRVAAEAANRAKDDLLAMVGHELRNPMAPIASALELLATRTGSPPPREVEVIGRQLAHLRQLVDNLLDVSAVARGELALARRPVALRQLVTEALDHIRTELAERGREVRIDVPDGGLVVDVDPERMQQVIVNLLSNAAKYTDPGGRIEIVGTRTDDDIVLRVGDDGAGMDPDMVANLFQPFVQGERRLEQARGGLGLGLALVRSLIEAHGGTVEARSEGRGKGSEFVVRLPASTAESCPARLSTAPDPRPAPSRRRVLVVDDNPDAADLLAEFLETAGYEVQVAYDPRQALDMVRDTPADAAILDIGLPDMDGYELAARLSGSSRPVLIAVTGYGRDSDRARSREAGFDHHFVKPISPRKILEALATL